MFTGIVTDIGTIISTEARGDLRITIGSGFDPDGIAPGASIACSGVCLTVVDKGTDSNGQHWFAVDVSAETVARTAEGMWKTGEQLNLERALKLGEELGGHIVTGHVDGTARVMVVRDEGASHRVAFTVGTEIAPFIAPKGSVTVDGVSLTVNDVRDEGDAAHFSVNIIPHTWEVTTLSRLVKDGLVNIEIDVLARYLSRLRERIIVV